MGTSHVGCISKIYEKIPEFGISPDFRPCWLFLEAENWSGRAREVFQKLAGGRGFDFPEYGPVASHGDPIRDQND